MFGFNSTAANHNSALLARFDYDLEKVLQAHPNTTSSYGSELRPVDQLLPLLRHHRLWPQFKQYRELGIDYPFIEDISECDRKAMLHKNLSSGNHRSALQRNDRAHVTRAIISDVELGYGIPLTIEAVEKLKHAEVYPLGLQTQQTIDEKGRSIPKKRLTHDLSHNRESKVSVNQRVDISNMPEAIYGHALLRFLHLIHHLRWLHPNQRILCNKIDVEKAYRRLHTCAKVSSKCIATWFLDTARMKDKIAILLERLPFGSSPAPPSFCTVSETVFDLANDLMNCDLWYPHELPSPYAKRLKEPDRTLASADAPFGAAEEADVKLSHSCKGGADGYIDDGACAVLDSTDNAPMVARAAQAVVMAIFLIFRPLAGNDEPITRPDPVSIRKMSAEGTLREIITFLGWTIDTRALTIQLPEDKHNHWRLQIISFLSRRSIGKDALSTLVGRLNHVCYIIPDARHFMNHLRAMEKIAEATKRPVALSHDAKEDLNLWLEFLASAAAGISLNRIVFRKPTQQSLSDASPWGMGGHSPSTKIAWRYEFTEEEQRALTMNCKEYLGVVVDSVIQARHDKSGSPFPCYLHRSDSTSAVGWMYKSNHDPVGAPIHNEIARYHARHTLAMNACNYSQHLPGCENVVTDCLSRDFHLSDAQISAMLTSVHPSLSNSDMKIVQVPEEITSWIASLARLKPDPMASLTEQSPSILAAGISGWSSCDGSDNALTPIWISSSHTTDFESAVLSSMREEEVILGQPDRRGKSSVRLLKRPSTMWQRPSSQIIGQTPPQTQEAKGTNT